MSARESPQKSLERSPRKATGLSLFGLIAIVAIAAAVAFYVFHKPRHKSYSNMAVANARTSAGLPRKAEFEKLFDDGTPLSSFARPGEYTVVEVYLDVCAYCREFEKGFDTFNDRRADVSFVRVHHPGRMNMRFDGTSAEEVRQKIEAANAKMKSYGFCGTPHVEVYRPDGKVLAKDSCGSRAGTVFMWDWITEETGVKPKRSPGGITGA
jgi:thiol:disulfide interchange protein